MVNFGVHLSLNQKSDWQEKYIDYELLKVWVNAIKADKINAEEVFIDVLEKEWIKYRDFINSWSMLVYLFDTNNTPNIWVFINIWLNLGYRFDTTDTQLSWFLNIRWI